MRSTRYHTSPSIQLKQLGQEISKQRWKQQFTANIVTEDVASIISVLVYIAHMVLNNALEILPTVHRTAYTVITV